ncbi:MAG TPA: hypothetical protein DEZ08_02470 [Dehalococcoidia bacterium]|nr:hypothetical protein [Dehalococcoidia bacterium]|tara:strand:+ start:350 stop:4687 length:4338 start_codon:yes stop_codon:yes gene_type:complete
MMLFNPFKTNPLLVKWIGVLSLLFLALLLRIYGFDWDQGIGFHPDERSIYMRSYCMYLRVISEMAPYYCEPMVGNNKSAFIYYINPSTSPFNPNWFPLGTILIYMLVIPQMLLSNVIQLDLMDLRFLGRSFSIIADVLAVLIYWRLGAKMFNSRIGIITAILIATSFIHIQHSHFYRPEPFLVLFIGLVLLNCWNLYKFNSVQNLAYLGLSLGIALAFKVSGFLLGAPILITFLYMFYKAPKWNFTIIATLIIKATLVFIIAAGVFFISSPFALLDFKTFFSDISAQSMMANNAGMWPFTNQYIGTAPIFYNLKQMFVWGVGPLVGIVIFIGIFYGLYRAIKFKHVTFGTVLLLSWILPFLLFMESYEIKFLRYIFPIIPGLFLLTAVFVNDSCISMNKYLTRVSSKNWKFKPKIYIYIMLSGFLLIHFLYTIAFINIYSDDHTAIQASEWINKEIPNGTKLILDSHWDEQIPNLYNYETWLYPAYDLDDIDKIYELVGNLATTEYVVFYSSRPYVGITSASEKYPYSSSYYSTLFEGKLGFEVTRIFAGYPNLGGIHLKDNPFSKTNLSQPDMFTEMFVNKSGIDFGYADENVVSYDHPLVLILKKTKHINERELLNVIMRADFRDDLYPYNIDNENKYLIKQSGTWSDLFSNPGMSSINGAFRWLFTLELICLIFVPIVFVAFKFLPDKGYGLNKLFGLFILSYFVWLVTSLELFEYGRSLIWSTVAVITSLSGYIIWKKHLELANYIRNNWKYILALELIFIISFIAFLFIRMNNPDLWHPWRGGEKPMEFAYFNALIKTTMFPPYDPWMSGTVMNYYYWGYVPLSVLSIMSNVIPSISFNLSIITLFSCSCALTFALGTNVYFGINKVNSDSFLAKGSSLGPIYMGLLSVIIVLVAGNLDGFLQIVSLIYEASIAGFGNVPINFDYWRSSRIIPLLNPLPNQYLMFWLPIQEMYPSPHITEFPFFTFLFADLHAHLIAIPFGLMVLLLGINVYATPSKMWFSIVSVSLFGLGVGGLFAINSWDYPTYCLLGLIILFLRAFFIKNTERPFTSAALLGILFVLVGYVAFLPFHIGFDSGNASLTGSVWATPISDYIIIKAMPIASIIAFVIALTLRRPRVWLKNPLMRSSKRMLITLGIGAVSLIFLCVVGFYLIPLLIFLILMVLLIMYDLMSNPLDKTSYKWIFLACVLMVYSLCIDFGVELIRYDNDIGRMNTLFKLYLQSWVISGVSTVALIYLFFKSFMNTRKNATTIVLAIGIFAVCSCALMYPLFSVSARVSDRFVPTVLSLNGTTFFDKASHQEKNVEIDLSDDIAMIEWIQANIKGTPVIVEAVGDQYRWNSRISSYTGLPTVLGWPWHQMQQKSNIHPEISRRVFDVNLLYNTPDISIKLSVINKYGIDFIIIGQLEKIYYDQNSLNKFYLLEDQGFLEPVYKERGSVIFKVQ